MSNKAKLNKQAILNFIKSHKSQAYKNQQEILKFIKSHGYAPKKQSKDAGEKRLGKFLKGYTYYASFAYDPTFKV